MREHEKPLPTDERVAIEKRLAAINVEMCAKIVKWSEWTRLHEERNALREALGYTNRKPLP